MAGEGASLTELVALPVWALVLLGGLAAIAVTDRLVAPLLRGIFATRREWALDHLNQRLAIPIARFKLAGRRALVTQLMLDPAVQAAVTEEIARTGAPRRQVEARAESYAREIVPAFSAALYFRVGARLARKLSTALYRVRVGASDIAALQDMEPDAAVVFVMNHRSNMDYVLVTYLASRSSALSYAVGEWARVPGLSLLIRSMGAYFIRRASGDQLYRRVLARYVHIATASGVTQAVFPEGGLSRDGRLQPARLGLIAYMVSDFDPTGPRDVVFVPVGLNYDRVLEDRVLLDAGARASGAPGQRPRFAFKLTTFLGYVGRMVTGRLLGRWYRNGYACVSFGKPVSLRRYLSERDLDLRTLSDDARAGQISHLAATIMDQVAAAIPALPVSLVALAIRRGGTAAMSRLELKAAVGNLMVQLRERGGQVYLPRTDEEYAVDVGLRMLVLRHLLWERDGLIGVTAGQEHVVAYYANAIAHIVEPAAAAQLRA